MTYDIVCQQYDVLCQVYDDPNAKTPLYYLLIDKDAWLKNLEYMSRNYPHIPPVGSYYHTDAIDNPNTYQQVVNAKANPNGGLEGCYRNLPRQSKTIVFTS